MPPKTAHPVADPPQEGKCKGCDEVVHPNPHTGKVDVQEHMRGSDVHRAKAKGRTSCPWCGKYCDPEGEGGIFLAHAYAEHPEINLDQQLTCLICGTKWPNTWYKEQHMAIKHPILWPPLTSQPPLTRQPPMTRQPPPPQQGPVRCHICGITWDNTQYHDQHMARAHPDACPQSHQHQSTPQYSSSGSFNQTAPTRASSSIGPGPSTEAGPSQQPQQSHFPPRQGQHARDFRFIHYQGPNHSGK